MSDILVLIPDPADTSYASQWPKVLTRLTDALAQTGATVRPTPWTEHAQDANALMQAALVLPVLTWGYYSDPALWAQACRTWAAAGVAIANPAEVLGWNADKTYLRRLQQRGVPIAPTLWVDQATPQAVQAAFDTLGVDRIIVKPTVSAGAWRTVRLSRGQPMDEPAAGAMMIQPYLPAIETAGETSLLFFGGRFSHAVNKRPVSGEFRIQSQFGGRYLPVVPGDEAMALAERVLAAIDEPLLYARIDIAPGLDGRLLLMEAELIEPDFYLGQDPQQGAGFAQAVRERL